MGMRAVKTWMSSPMHDKCSRYSSSSILVQDPEQSVDDFFGRERAPVDRVGQRDHGRSVGVEVDLAPPEDLGRQEPGHGALLEEPGRLHQADEEQPDATH